MAFIKTGSTVVSFAEYQDVLDTDKRLFEANEGLTEDIVEQFLTRSTERVLTLIRATDWWRDLYLQGVANPQLRTVADLPPVNPTLIGARLSDFTELTVMYALWNYLYPYIADFSKEDNAERAKIGFYQGKFQARFDELINAGDWYDQNADGTIASVEKMPGHYAVRRVR